MVYSQKPFPDKFEHADARDSPVSLRVNLYSLLLESDDPSVCIRWCFLFSEGIAFCLHNSSNFRGHCPFELGWHMRLPRSGNVELHGYRWTSLKQVVNDIAFRQSLVATKCELLFSPPNPKSVSCRTSIATQNYKRLKINGLPKEW